MSSDQIDPGSLAAIHRVAQRDSSSRGERYDRMTRLVCETLDTPMAAVSILGEVRHWIGTAQGMSMSEIPRSAEFCEYAIRQQRMLEVHDVRVDARFANSEMSTADPNVVFYVSYPIKSPEGLTVGAICGMDVRPRVLSDTQRKSLSDLAGLIEDQFALGVLANRDVLTGLHNRRYFDECLEREWRRQERLGVPVSLLFFDVDEFKNYNDAFGHPSGDACLQRIADVANQEFVRAGDCLARYGGEEFVALLSGTDEAGAQTKAEQLRAAIEKMGMKQPPTTNYPVVTISIGGVTITPARNIRSETLLELADAALYRAKEGGRNQVWWDDSGVTNLGDARNINDQRDHGGRKIR